MAKQRKSKSIQDLIRTANRKSDLTKAINRAAGYTEASPKTQRRWNRLAEAQRVRLGA